MYIYISNLAIFIYKILDPLTPSGKSTENRRRKRQGKARGLPRVVPQGGPAQCQSEGQPLEGGRRTAACPPAACPSRPGPSTPVCGVLGEHLSKAGDCGSSNIGGPESN